MRREYARLRVDIWEDDDFRGLDPLPQWLYLHLLTHPSLSFCGVVDWRPKRIAVASPLLVAADVEEAMEDLVEARFVVVDEDTEEALVRSFVRHDGLLASPNVTTAMVREFRGIASRRLRGIVVHELLRAHTENPTLKGWDRARELLAKEPVDPYPNPSPNPSGDPSGNPSANPSEETAEPLGEQMPHSVLPAVDSVSPHAGEGAPPPAPQGGRVRGREAAAEPPPRCPRHLEQPADGACGPCGDARRAHEAWAKDREQRRRDAGPVVGQECPDHPGERAGLCRRCAAAAVRPPQSLRALRDEQRAAS